MTMKKAYRELLVMIRRYEREGVELWHWSKREFLFKSEAYKKLDTTKNKYYKTFIFKIIDRMNKLEKDFDKFQEKIKKERNEIITAIEVMKTYVNYTVNIDYDNKNNEDLKNILDKICNDRNKQIAVNQ